MKRAFLLLLLIAVTYAGLAAWLARTLRPRADEGFFASPALNLATTGSMGTLVLEGHHQFMKDIHQYTYWITPLHFLAQAAWYKVFGFSMFSMRTLSIAFALAALGAWFLIVRRISGRDGLAVFTVALIGLDYNFAMGGSSGRMDMMAAGLGFSAFAAYLLLRERRFTAAVVIANTLVCAAGLTHPVAGYLYFSGLVLLTLYYDRARLRWQHLAFAALPYLAGLGGWGLYILKDPSAFLVQFGTNTTMKGRLTGLTAPWLGIVHEVLDRYLVSFGLGPHSISNRGPIYLKFLILVWFVAGLIGAVATREIRANKGYRALMLLAGLFFLLLSVLDGQKAYYYLIHIFPFYAALAAAFVFRLWDRRLAPRWMVSAAVAGVLVLQIGAIVLRCREDTYRRTYDPVIAFLQRTLKPGDTVIASASLGFGLRFPRTLIDDVRLGYYTGRRPNYIVINEEYYLVFCDYQHSEPEFYRFIAARLAREYERIYDRDGYQVYALREGAAAPQATAQAIQYP